MNRYILTYTEKYRAKSRKAQPIITSGLTIEVEALSTNWARAEFMTQKLAPGYSRNVTRIQEVN